MKEGCDWSLISIPHPPLHPLPPSPSQHFELTNEDQKLNFNPAEEEEAVFSELPLGGALITSRVSDVN